MDSQDARACAEHLLAGDLPQRWQHVQAVAAEVGRLCAAMDLDTAVLMPAAWLHDVGYAPAAYDTGFHPLDAARYLAARGWNDTICGLVAYHTDAVTQADHLGLGQQLRAEFRDIGGVLRDVLWTADVTTGPTGQHVTTGERIAEISARYGPDNFVTQCMIDSRPVLEAAATRVTAACAQSLATSLGPKR